MDWARKVDLYIEAGIGPDGHEMQQGAYADFEFAKYAAGYMVCYLYWRDRRPVASVSLAVHKGFARLKNVVLHPDARGQGLGHKIVRALIAEAVGARATRFGAFAAEGGPAHNVYRNCGLRDATYQKEWTKPL